MKTAQIFWLVFAVLMVSAFMPSQAAVPNSVNVTIEFVAAEVNVPAGGHAPYNEFTHFCAISDNVEGFDTYENMTADDLADLTIDSDTDTVLLKFYYNQNVTGYKADPWYLTDGAIADYGEVVVNQTEDPQGLNSVNTTIIETWLDNATLDHTDAMTITEYTADAHNYWWSPVIWYEPGFTMFAVADQIVLTPGSSMTVTLGEEHTVVSLTSFCMNMYEMEGDLLMEDWYSYNTNLEVGILKAGEEGGIPFNMVYVMLGLLSVGAIATLVNKRN